MRLADEPKPAVDLMPGSGVEGTAIQLAGKVNHAGEVNPVVNFVLRLGLEQAARHTYVPLYYSAAVATKY